MDDLGVSPFQDTSMCVPYGIVFPQKLVGKCHLWEAAPGAETSGEECDRFGGESCSRGLLAWHIVFELLLYDGFLKGLPPNHPFIDGIFMNFPL